MSYNDDNEWQTVGGGNRHHHQHEGNSEGAWRRKNDQSEDGDDRRHQGGNYGQGYQADEQQFPALGGQEIPNRRQSQAEEDQPSWQSQSQTQTEAHQEDRQSRFSLGGMFSALKTKVQEKLKAKFHELTDELRASYKLPASEQQYAEPVSPSRVNVEPTQEELGDMARAASRLWDLDINRLTPGKDYEIDVGHGKKVYQKQDAAENALFSHVDQSVFKRPTYARFLDLLDNYHEDENVAERIDAQQQHEETAFIEEISRTAPIQYLQKYLAAKDIVQGDDLHFKQTLLSLWFKLYNRGGTRGSSSAFEHVFVGEIKHGRDNEGDEISGLHNWIQFSRLESRGDLDYEGFILPRRRGDAGPDSQSHLLSVQFKWKGITKPVTSTLIGVSPEFELALYTLCFFAGGEDNRVTLGPYFVNIKVYPLGRSIGCPVPYGDHES